MLKNRFLLLLCLLLSFWIHLNAQTITRYGISNGVAHNHIRYFYQDTEGYIWIGTWNGISKFDGHHFSTFKHNPEDEATIFNDEVSWITEDSSGNIWSHTNEGIMKYSGGENFSRIYLDESHREHFNPLGFQPLLFDFNGMGWFLEAEGLFYFSDDLSMIRKIDVSGLVVNKNSALMADHRGLWLLANSGLYLFTYNLLEQKTVLTGQMAEIFIPVKKMPDDQTISFMYKIQERLIIHYSQHGLYEVDPEAGVLKLLMGVKSPEIDERITELRRIAEISPGVIAFGHNRSGVICFDVNKQCFIQDHPLLDFTNNINVHTILLDNQQNIWVGSMEGVFKYTKPQLSFKSWLSGPEGSNSLSGKNLTNVHKDSYNQIWVSSTSGGIERIDPESGEITAIRLPDEFSNITNVHRGNYVYQLDDRMFLLAFDSAVFTYDPEREKFNFVFYADRHVRQVTRDRDGTLYLIASNAFYVLNYADGDLILEKEFRGRPRVNKFHSNWDVEIIGDHLLLAQRPGLSIVNKNDFSDFKTYSPDDAEAPPYVLCVEQAKNGLIWVGTIRNGIYAFDLEKRMFVRHFDMADGLIDNSVNAIFEDDKGILWASTWKGVVRLNPQTGKVDNFSTANGLSFPEFNTEVYDRGEDGTIYFGGLGGLIAFHPDNFVNFEFNRELKIVGVNAANDLLPLKYPLKNDELLTLDFDQDDFSVFFSSFDFRHPQQRIYRYRLNGFDSKWQQTISNYFVARYSSVPPGIYTLIIQSTYNEWPWVDAQTRLMIRVKPPPLFQRQNFQFAILVVLGLSILTIVFMRMRNLNMKKQVMISRLEKESNLSKLNFLKSQMNPHFYFNTLNAINSFVLKHEIREANIYLTRFAKLMREILDNSQKEFVKIADEKAVLEKYLSLQQLRFQGLFEYQIKIDPELMDKAIPPMFLQPFIENSVEYAFVNLPEKGWLEVNFESDNNEVVCTVIDNGIGIDRSMQIKKRSNRKSTAIHNIYKRIDILNEIYDLDIQIEITKPAPENEQFPGTKIVLRLPDFEAFITNNKSEE